jgi:hypothetical protein
LGFKICWRRVCLMRASDMVRLQVRYASMLDVAGP